MADTVIEDPILNSPFREPNRHWRFGDTSITNEIVEGRRSSSYFMPIPDSKVRGKQLQRVSLAAGAAQHDRPLPSPNVRHRTERDDTPPPREETATADDDLVRVVNVPLVADVIQPADVRAVAREHPVAPAVGEEPAELRLCPGAPLAPATLLHGTSVVTLSAGSRLT